MPENECYVKWCCSCGEVDPDGSEVCPVSDLWMQSMGGKGLQHLIAYGIHERAMKSWERAVEWRERAGFGDRRPPQ